MVCTNFISKKKDDKHKSFGSLLMVSQAGNQIRDKIIKSYPKTDGQKLAGLEKFLRHKYPDWIIKIEPYLLFTKGEDEYLCCFSFLTEGQVKRHTVHHPDIHIVRGGKPVLILELDGPWHDKHVEATCRRNKRYEDNLFDLIVINETDLKFELDLKISARLTQDQINEAFQAKISNLSL